MEMWQDGEKLYVETPAFSARFDNAKLVSIIDRQTGVEFLRDSEVSALEVTFTSGDPLTVDKHQHTVVRQLSPLASRVIISGNDSERELFIRLDPDTGDLCVTPSGRTSRGGVHTVRWNLSFTEESALVLPCVNGLIVESDRPFPSDSRFQWPFTWNAQLAIAERGNASLMIHSEDTAYKFKRLNLSRNKGYSTLGFESEQVGPLWNNRNAGGVEWRLNVYDGNWQKPASRYREWMQKVYILADKRAHRPKWVDDISFCYCWVHSDPELLEAMARLYPAEKSLIHLSHWRTSEYDIDYPDYFPSDKARAFLEKANAMGFRVMPHFNYWACYDKHPLYARLRDWQIRGTHLNEPQGWYWPPETHDFTRLAYIHPGLGLWRRTIIDAVLEARREVNAPAVFLDQTLCTWNTDNGIIENMTTVEGMWRLQEEFTAVQPDIVLAGEGLNEISFQRQCFAQGHIHDGWGSLTSDHVKSQHSICSYLWGDHCRLVGYFHLNPKDEDAELGIEVYRRMGTIPTITKPTPETLDPSNPVIKKLVELASA